jgi:CheY-like chemotaxis protein
MSSPAADDIVNNNVLDHAPFKGLKVLVVDDDARNIFSLTALLERGNAEVTSAQSGPEAMLVLQRQPDIDVVLMDVMMPVMDGYAAIRAIRALDGFASLPILTVTSKDFGGERERGIAAGANEYVPKPVDSVELVNAMRPWLRTTPRAAT